MASCELRAAVALRETRTRTRSALRRVPAGQDQTLRLRDPAQTLNSSG
jgi:antitoxin (DNA-binding transcriptional repressor) of toxin-antitoxin stability system